MSRISSRDGYFDCAIEAQPSSPNRSSSCERGEDASELTPLRHDVCHRGGPGWCPARWSGGVYASDAPETPKVRIGIIALTDCSSIVMAHELGLFKKHGIESTISKEASWAVIRDRLTLGENQATHMLLGIPYAATMGLQGSPVKPMIIPMYLNRNGQAITLTKASSTKGSRRRSRSSRWRSRPRPRASR